MNIDNLMLLLILVPFLTGVVVLALRGGLSKLTGPVAILAATANLALAVMAFGGDKMLSIQWVGMGIEFAIRLYSFSSFILLAVAGFAFLVTLYSLVFMNDRPHGNQFFSYLLISVGMVNGAVLADNLVLLLFFWEGLLVTLFGMVAIGRVGAFKTATKAFIIVGVTDLCMMVGIALTGYLASGATSEHWLNMSTIAGLKLSVSGLGGLAMVMLMIGAISKAGSMPFHSWIPDAAIDAPLPFMAILPASLEKLLGIYFLSRITLDLYHVEPTSWASFMLMIIGSVTILLAVMMALVQKNYKRLLSYHAISQVGYMVLGVGTALPIGIIGGLFHMINHAMYKSCLFLTGGSVEKQTGTTDLEQLGGIGRKMPVTFTCFIVAAAAISGFPLTNGFYSKELVYQAAWDRNIIFYCAALLGTFLTAASFLKLGHAAFLGKRDPRLDNVKEASPAMLIPMIVIAAGCMLFGLYNVLPLTKLVIPSVTAAIGAEHLKHIPMGLEPHNWTLVILTCLALAGALFNHLKGVRMSGSGLHAADHIQHAAVLDGIYKRAMNRAFDPYDQGLKAIGAIARLGWAVDRGIDWIYECAAAGTGVALSLGVRRVHNGNYSTYVLWSLAATIVIIVCVAVM